MSDNYPNLDMPHAHPHVKTHATPSVNCKITGEFAPSCGCALRLTDRDLPPIARTEANLWKAKYFEAMRELTRANKGIRRLKEKCDRLLKAHNVRISAGANVK